MLVPITDSESKDSWGRYNSPTGHLVTRDKKIAFIKWVRTCTGWGLKEAKDYVDNHYYPRTKEYRIPVIDKRVVMSVVDEEDIFASCVTTKEVIL